MKVVAIIPAHNEEEGIEKTIMSIVEQGHRVEKILVACDNCTDKTPEICERISLSHREVDYFLTVGNEKRKAGALNQAFDRIKDEDWDFLLQVDADSFLRKDLLEEGIKEFEKNPKLGGLCSRFRVRDYKKGNRFLYTLQYLEYSFFDSMQIEKGLYTHVLSGTASLLKREALEMFFPDPVWDENSIVEDYSLTLELREMGWEAKVGKNMHIKTDYMHTWKDLWKQRKRWIYGTAEELMKHGWQSYTRRDIVGQWANLFFGFFQIAFIILLTYLLIIGEITEWHPLGILVPVVVLVNKVYRNKYIEKKTFLNLFVANTLVFEFFYHTFLVLCNFYCYFRLIFNMQPKWQ